VTVQLSSLGGLPDVTLDRGVIGVWKSLVDGWDGQIRYMYLFDRALSDSEMASVSSEMSTPTAICEDQVFGTILVS
jgi:hypothetical protein